MAYAFNTPGEPEKLDFIAIHQSASDHARNAYTKEFGVDYHDDPEYKTGNARHKFWLSAFEKRQESLILNPHQE